MAKVLEFHLYGNPFQTTQGNRLSCRDQEGRRGSEEAVLGPSVFPSREPGVKLKLQYFGHLMQRVDSLEKTLMLARIGGRWRR